MNRREFLSTAIAGAAGAGAPSLAAETSTAPTTKPSAELNLVPPPPGVEYFTHQRLAELVDVSKPIDDIDFQLVCYVCNLWHPTPVLEQWYGKGFTEWEICRRAKALYEGHDQPKRPLWGYYKEAEVEWATREIDLAASSGLHAFMVDWYWHDGAMFMHEWLEDAFLKSPSRDKMQFAIMWANHPWTNIWLSPEEGEEAVLLPQTYSEADMDRLAGYVTDKYFSQPNYWKIDEKPVFGILIIVDLIRQFSSAGTRKILDRWQERAIKAGHKGVHFQSCGDHGPVAVLPEAGIESMTDYHTFATNNPRGGRTNFAKSAEVSIARWSAIAAGNPLPYFPEVPVGWDNSPRYGKKAHIVTHRSADQFERLLLAAKHTTAARNPKHPIIFTGAWNEWTEDHYLLPDATYGYSYLEAVKRQFKKAEHPA